MRLLAAVMQLMGGGMADGRHGDEAASSSHADGGAKKKAKKAQEVHCVHVMCNAVCTCSLQANTHM